MIETTDRLPMLSMVGIFMGLTILVVAGIAGVEYLWPELKLPNSLGVVTTIVAAMQSGMFAARRTKRMPTWREKLVFAVWATAASLLAAVGFFWALFGYYGIPFTLMTFLTALLGNLPDAGLMKVLPWILLFAVAVSLLAIYFSVGSGAKVQLKALDRQAAKGK